MHFFLFYFTSRNWRYKNLQVMMMIRLKLLSVRKLKGQDMALEEKWKFSRFPSFRLCPIPKIGNSGNLILLKFLIILRMLIFLVVYETQNRKNDLKYGLRRKHVRFRGFRVFDFALYLKSKTWRPRKVFVYFIQFFIFLVASYGCIKHGKD